MQKQNDVFYIQEAFKKLQFLNEDSFNLQDVGVVDELTSFVADDKDAPWIEEIIDVESDFTDELQDSYVGKVILQCKCCNAKIYKDASEVFVSEEDECANVEEECPLCGNAYGWSVIGKIEPYNEEEFKEEEPVEADLELDLTDDEINEALKKSINEKKYSHDEILHYIDELKGKLSDEEIDVLVTIGDDAIFDKNKKAINKVKKIFAKHGIPYEIFEPWFTDYEYFDMVARVLTNENLKKSISEDLDIHVQQDENGNVEEVIIEKEPEDNVVIDDESPKLSGDDIIIDESYNREEFKKGILSSYRRVKTLFGDKLDKFLDILEKESNNGEKEVLHILYPDKYNGKNSKFYLNEFGLDITKHGVASTIADILWSFDSANNDLLDDTKYMVSVTYFDPDSPDEDTGPQYVSRDLKKLVDTINSKENLNIKFDTVNKSIESDEFSHDYTYDGEYIDVWFKKLKKFDHVDDYINLDESLNEEVDIKVDSTPEGELIAEIEVDEGEHVEVVDKEEVELPADDIEVVEEGCHDKLKEELIEHESHEDVTTDCEEASDDACQLENPEEDPVLEEPNAIKELKAPVDLIEGVENLSLDTEDTHMEMTSDENGKVTVVTEPRKEVEEVIDVEDEMIAPLTDEEKVEIENNEEVVDEPVEDEFEIDEFEEETFNELGESFLKRVYENVNSFKTSSVAYKKGQLVVEGLIKFNSGKEKSTSFIFEKFKNTKRNKVVVTGLNETFSKSKSAFMLKGDLKNKRFVSESLIYNYSTHSLNESNKQEAVKVYGRAIVRNK